MPKKDKVFVEHAMRTRSKGKPSFTNKRLSQLTKSTKVKKMKKQVEKPVVSTDEDDVQPSVLKNVMVAVVDNVKEKTTISEIENKNEDIIDEIIYSDSDGNEIEKKNEKEENKDKLGNDEEEDNENKLESENNEELEENEIENEDDKESNEDKVESENNKESKEDEMKNIRKEESYDGDEKINKSDYEELVASVEQLEKSIEEQVVPMTSDTEDEENDEDKEDGDKNDKVGEVSAKNLGRQLNRITTSDGKKRNFHIISWNFAALRAFFKNNGHDFLKMEKPDVICIQEIKCQEDQVPPSVEESFPDYEQIWWSADRKGNWGTGILTKVKPISIQKGFDKENSKLFNDNEGRVITVEFEKFYLINTYVLNSGAQLKRLTERVEKWDLALINHLNKLNKNKPIIWCGDLNVCHMSQDIKNATTNIKSSGFTPEERLSFQWMLDGGIKEKISQRKRLNNEKLLDDRSLKSKGNKYVDVFRHFYPDVKEIYSYWSVKGTARQKNVGWRLDYFITTPSFVEEHVCDCIIHDDVKGSDHCPISIYLSI
ncbi:hypothetical protein SNEBB_000824 [Seison nebaliae]|nr:hypothetical protein SNEBB_000824 [Seison nebaliae]